MPAHLAELSDALRRRSLTLFVGPDLPATLTGVPPRAELARGLAARHGLDEGLSLAAAAQRVMERGSRFVFTDYLGRQLGPQGAPPGPLHRQIVALDAPAVISTCYDQRLEQAYAAAGVEIGRVVRDSDLPFVDPRRPVLIKLYGDLAQRDTLVVTEDDHYGLLRSRDREGLLDEVRRLLRATTVLFVGQNLAAPDFMLLWREALDRMGRFAVGAFAVWPGLPEVEQRVWAERMVRVIDAEPLALLAGLAGEPPPALPTTAPLSAPAGPAPARPPDGAAPRPAEPASDLEIWLRRRPGAPHEAIVTFRPAGAAADEHLVEGAAPAVALDPLLLLQHTADIAAYGEAIGAALFADMRLAVALVRAQERALGAGVPLRLRLRLDPDDPALHAVRWELVRDPQRAQFLCARGGLRFSRHLAASEALQPRPRGAGAPAALVAAASPRDLGDYGLPPLDVGAELGRASAALAGYAVTTLPGASLPALADALRAGPDILYLICHGALLEDGDSCLYLEGPGGGAAPARSAQVAAALEGLAVRPRLVVLAACQSAGATAHAGGRVALGPLLAQAGIGAVLAMHDSVRVETVAAGMPVLFDELRRHGSVDRAAAAMRSLLAARGDEWWQPVLYMRLRDGQLWSAGAPA